MRMYSIYGQNPIEYETHVEGAEGKIVHLINADFPQYPQALASSDMRLMKAVCQLRYVNIENLVCLHSMFVQNLHENESPSSPSNKCWFS